jgi:hypothetical protein
VESSVSRGTAQSSDRSQQPPLINPIKRDASWDSLKDDIAKDRPIYSNQESFELTHNESVTSYEAVQKLKSSREKGQNLRFFLTTDRNLFLQYSRSCRDHQSKDNHTSPPAQVGYVSRAGHLREISLLHLMCL